MRMSVLGIVAAVVALLIAFVCTFLIANRPQLIAVDAALPDEFPQDGFAHDTFEELLQTYVDGAGNVDFDSWHDNATHRGQLDAYLAGVSRFSPERTPERFPRKSDELAYWMYGYNAYVIKSVLDHWPIDSVTDVRAPIEAVTGLGFFFRQRFHFGGVPLNLYTVENEKIRKAFHDPRIHFVLYCASGSCPVLRPELPTGEDLERLLEKATEAFVSDPKNVRIDHEHRKIVLSAIFRMYRSDFLREMTRRGLPSGSGVIDYVMSVAPQSLRAELERASDYETEFAEYDWSIKKAQ